MLRRMWLGIVRRVDPDAWIAAFAGGCAGLMIVGVLDLLLGRFGYTPESTAALLLLGGSVLAFGGQHRTVSAKRSWGGVALLVACVIWSAFASFWNGAAAAGVASLPFASLENVAVRLAAMVAAAAFVLGPGLVGLVRWPAILVRDSCRWRTYGFGLVGGVVLDVTALAPAFGSNGVMIAGVGILATLTFVAAFRARSAETPMEESSDGSTETSSSHDFGRVLGTGVLGIAAACVVRLTFELTVPSAALLHLAWVAPLLGGLVLARRSWTAARPEVAVSCGLAWAMLFVVMHGTVVDTVLTLNANVESLWLQVLARSGLVLLFGLPIGLAWGALRSDANDERGRGRWFESPATFAVGVVLGSSFASVVGEAAVLAAATIGVGTWIVIGRLVARSLPAGWWRRAVLVAATGFLLAGPFWASRHRPERAAKLLFSTHVIVAERTDGDPRLREFRDGTRLVAQRPGPNGTTTVWSHLGLQQEVRIGGLPIGVTSREPRVCPRNPVETLVAVMPLVLHDAPRRVLHLGLDDGVPLATTLEFPVQSVTCIEADRSHAAVLRGVVWSGVEDSPFEDDRTRIVDIPPRLAVRCDRETYDVVISNPPHSGLARVAPLFSPDFYRDCRARLAEGGIVCQRLRSVDYGAAVTADMIQGFRQAFAETLVYAAGPGDLLLIGANEEGRLHPPDLAVRLAATHVRQALEEAGWDWSTPLTLATLDESGLSQLTAEVGTSPAASRQPYRLALETARWGEKFRDQAEVCSRYAVSPFDQLPAGSRGVVEATSRIADVKQAAKIRRENPDEWWQYRMPLKRMLQSSRVVQAGHADRIHPVDRHRLDYLVALGDAVEEPTIGTIQDVLRYTLLPDPIVGYFGRAEAVRLFEDCPERLPHEELEQRLWLLLHEDALDRSIRNLAAAITLLAEHPEAVANETHRWDLLNGMLQSLVDRWENRAKFDPLPSDVLLKDVGLTLDARDRAFEALEELADAGVASPKDWSLRAEFLDKRLTGPLKTYRETLQAHRAREERKARAAAEEFDADTDEDDTDGPPALDLSAEFPLSID